MTSECPLCGGSGHIYNKEENRYTRCKCVEMEIKKDKLKFADIPDEFKDLQVNDFNTEIYDSDDNKRLARIAKKIVVNYVKNFESINKKGKGLYFYSSSKGSGKTRLMVGLGNALIKVHMKSAKFVTTNNLLDEIKNTFNNNTYSKLIEDIKRVDILILDDLGAERPTEWVNEIFYNILNDRMIFNKITMFTSNCEVEDLKYDERTINRIEKMAMPVKFPEQSVRRILAQRENEELMKLLMED